MKQYFTAICLLWIASTALACKSSTGEESGHNPAHGEINFVESSDLDVSTSRQDLKLNMEVYERTTAYDLLKLGVSVQTDKFQMDIVAQEDITPPDNGIVIDNTYNIQFVENQGMNNHVNFRVSDDQSEYMSVNGTISFKFKTGILEGAFEADICSMEDWEKIIINGQSDVATKHISGNFKTDAVDFRCYTIDGSTAKSEDSSGVVVVWDTAYSGTRTDTDIGNNLSSSEHPFCQKYL